MTHKLARERVHSRSDILSIQPTDGCPKELLNRSVNASISAAAATAAIGTEASQVIASGMNDDSSEPFTTRVTEELYE